MLADKASYAARRWSYVLQTAWHSASSVGQAFATTTQPVGLSGMCGGAGRRTDRGGVDVVYCATCEADSFLVEEARKQRAGGAARVLIATNDVDVQVWLDNRAGGLPHPTLLYPTNRGLEQG